MPASNKNKVDIRAKIVEKVKFSNFVGERVSEREEKELDKNKKEKNDNFPLSLDCCVTKSSYIAIQKAQ